MDSKIKVPRLNPIPVKEISYKCCRCKMDIPAGEEYRKERSGVNGRREDIFCYSCFRSSREPWERRGG